LIAQFVHTRAQRRIFSLSRGLPGILVALCLALWLAPAQARGPQPNQTRLPPQRVLVLHSYHPEYTWTTALTRGISDAFTAHPEYEVLTAYLDAKRFENRADNPVLRELLKRRYQDYHIALIICCDNYALDLLLEDRAAFLPDVPVVFCGINNFRDDMIAGHNNITGVAEEADLIETLLVGLRLHPDTQRIAVVADTTVTGDAVLERFRKRIADRQGLPPIQYITVSTSAELQERLKRLPIRTLVVSSALALSSAGQSSPTVDITQTLIESAPGPVYVAWDFMVLAGCTGGYVVDGFSHGQRAGQMALEVLGGTSPANLPVQRRVGGAYMFDDEQLTRFRVARTQLPQGSIIVNRPHSLYRQYWHWFWLAAAFAVGETTLLSLLLWFHLRQRRTATALRHSEQRFELAIRGSHDGLWDWDPVRNELYWSPRFYQSLGYEPNEIPPSFDQFQEWLHPRDRTRMRTAIAQHFRDRVPFDVEYRLLNKHGEYRWFHARAQALWDDRGRAVRMVGSTRDITERVRAQEELYRTNEEISEALQREREAAACLEATLHRLEDASHQAQAATHAKTEFLANMSHEIRTPMTAILGFSEQLIDPDVPDGDRQAAALSIRRNGEYLLGIVNDILDLSKIEAGKMTVERMMCSPCKLLAEVLALARVPATAKKLPLEVEYLSPMPEFIYTDPTRLRQVLLNIIGNAVKFTQVGQVRVLIRYERDTYRPHLQFDVSDSGVGMTHEQIERLFQPFTQADTSTTRQFGGTGLGLVICQRLVQMLDGTITVVRSTPGEGTCFRITVGTGDLANGTLIDDPLAATALDTRKPKRDEPSNKNALNNVRVLLAEDGVDNQRLVSMLLRRAGAAVTIVENGRQAVDAVLAAKHPGERFHVILMDMQMPVLDGYEATRELRHAGYTGPILALTAHAMTQDRERCLTAGCDDYASKPVQRNELIALVSQYAVGTTDNAVVQQTN
jgi:PAS domain S-box-containing protein